MDLMTLAAKIVLDDSSYTKGIQNAESMGQKLAGKMSAMTVAVGNLAADMVKKGVNGIQQVIGGAIDGFADYEQLIGGVETLFKSSSKRVATYAKMAFRTTGLSANEYMETVTSFSASLLQGLGGDTEKAADLANTAVTDMADNANKMGTDISSIQAAYQGFAKQNYTMLDNLKLGYGGTQNEMVRLINDSGILNEKISDLDNISFAQMIQAIHEIQSQLGVTGTTATEAAETISGSKASMKAAWEDLLSAVGGEGDQKRLDQTLENFKTSFSTYMENFIPTLVTTISNSGSLVTGIADAISELPTTLLSDVANAGLGAGAEMIGGVSKITSWLIDSIANMFKSASADPTQIANLGVAIGDFLGTAISDIVKNAPAIITGIIDVGIALSGGLVEGLFKGLFGEDAEVDKITEQLKGDITDVDMDSAKASALVEYIRGLSKEYGDAALKTQEFQQAREELESLLPGAGEVFQRYGDDIRSVTENLDKMIKKQKETAIMAGLQKALADEYELLGEQRGRQAKAEAKAEIAGIQQQGLKDKMTTSLQAYAREWLNVYGSQEGTSQAAIAEAKNLLKGKVFEGGELVDINSASAELINQMIQSFGAAIQNGEHSIWEKDLNDDILSPEELQSFSSEIANLQNDIVSAQADAAEAAKQAAATQKELELTDLALARNINNASDSFDTASSDVLKGGLKVSAAFSSVASAFANAKGQLGFFSGGYHGSVPMYTHAKGAWSVPYDNYPALLHRDERVLTASQARKEEKQGIDLSAMYEVVGNAIREGMNGVSVNSYLGSRKVTDEVSRNMARELKARRFRP